MTAPCGAVVIGLGNIALSDDGVGVHAVRRLRERGALPDVVELIEGGPAGLLLLPNIADAGHVVNVDAIDSGTNPGTLIRLDGADWAKAFAVRMTPTTSVSPTCWEPRSSAQRGPRSSYCTACIRARHRSAPS